MNEQLTILQNMREFSKKTNTADNVARTIYTELLRFNKFLEIELERQTEENTNQIKYEKIYNEMDNILGHKEILLRRYFDVLREFEIINKDQFDTHQVLQVNKQEFDEFKSYLDNEIEIERYLILSFEGFSLLINAIVGYTTEETSKTHEKNFLDVFETGLKQSPFYEIGCKELVKHRLIEEEHNRLLFTVEEIFTQYRFQSVIKKLVRLI